MTRLAAPLALVVATVLATGCASVEEQKKTLAARTATTARYADMSFEAIAVGARRTLNFDKNSPVFEFSEGKGYFAALALPALDQERFVEFQSPVSGAMLSSASTLIPRFVFVDGDKTVLDTVTPARIQRTETPWPMMEPVFVGRVPIPSAAKYVVVRAADSTAKPLTLFSSNGTPWTIGLAPAGKVDLTLSTQQMATVADSGVPESSSKAQLFYLSEIDGKSIRNARTDSAAMSNGTGFTLNTDFTERDVPARRMKVRLVGSHQTGAPIQAIVEDLAGTYLSVDGVVDFEPRPGKRYVVKGNLVKGASSVWIEDADSGQPATEKVVSR